MCSVLGDESVRAVSDQEIKNFLWETYFDEEQTIRWVLGTLSNQATLSCSMPPVDEQDRRIAARERKGEIASHILLLPPPPLRTCPCIIFHDKVHFATGICLSMLKRR